MTLNYFIYVVIGCHYFLSKTKIKKVHEDRKVGTFMSEIPKNVEREVINLLLTSTTKNAQDYLMSTMNVKRSKTSNYIKKMRKQLNLYSKLSKHE